MQKKMAENAFFISFRIYTFKREFYKKFNFVFYLPYCHQPLEMPINKRFARWWQIREWWQISPFFKPFFASQDTKNHSYLRFSSAQAYWKVYVRKQLHSLVSAS